MKIQNVRFDFEENRVYADDGTCIGVITNVEAAHENDVAREVSGGAHALRRSVAMHVRWYPAGEE